MSAAEDARLKDRPQPSQMRHRLHSVAAVFIAELLWRTCHATTSHWPDGHPAHRRIHLHRFRAVELLSRDHPRRLGAAEDVDEAARARSGIGEPRAADSGVSRAHATAYDSHRYLRRPRQVPSATAVLAHEKVRYVPAAARGGRGAA